MVVEVVEQVQQELAHLVVVTLLPDRQDLVE
jgi:hypothetical protein